MTTFSPNYNTITIAVKVENNESDSMRQWTTKETKTSSIYRYLNVFGAIPITGAFVGSYRITTGLLDVISSIFKLRVEKSAFNQGRVGVQNIARGTVEVISTLALFKSAHFLEIVIPSLLLFCWNLLPYDCPDSKAPVAAFFDGIPSIELTPTIGGCYTGEEWLEQLKKYGTWVRKDFIPV